jgi:hypothetical protein
LFVERLPVLGSERLRTPAPFVYFMTGLFRNEFISKQRLFRDRNYACVRQAIAA